MDLSQSLLKEAVQAVHDGETAVEYNGQTIDFSSLQRVSMKEAIAEFWPDRETAPALEDLDDPERVRQLIENA